MARHEKRILVVDDDDAIRALLFTVLRRRGFRVDTARNGADAMARCERCHYALILLDLMMPVMSGYAFLQALPNRTTPECRPLVIVLTAGTEPRNLDPELVAGSVHKPFDIELLVDTVAGCLSTLPECAQPDDCPSSDSELRETIAQPHDEAN